MQLKMDSRYLFYLRTAQQKSTEVQFQCGFLLVGIMMEGGLVQLSSNRRESNCSLELGMTAMGYEFQFQKLLKYVF